MRRIRDEHAKVDALVVAIPQLMAQHGLTAHLAGRTREAIEFTVTKP